MKKLLMALAAAALVGTVTTEANAQVSFGAQLSIADDTDLGIGARANFGLPYTGVRVIASFDYFFPEVDGFDYFEINGNVAYSIPVLTPGFSPYVGGGLNLARASVDAGSLGDVSDTELGFNLLGGASFGIGPIKPFAELRIELGGGEQFVIAGGINF
jgi:hypothetical protein